MEDELVWCMVCGAPANLVTVFEHTQACKDAAQALARRDVAAALPALAAAHPAAALLPPAALPALFLDFPTSVAAGVPDASEILPGLWAM